jgi:uncharacterized membrane protein
MFDEPLVDEPFAVLSILLTVLAFLFTIAQSAVGKKVFRYVPLLVFAYFVPTTISNVGIIPLQSDLYDAIKHWILPASLILLTMSIDIPAIMKLGPHVLILFLGGTASVVVGGPLAYLALGWTVPTELGEQAWKGLAALSGSWIGGGANMVAIKESVGAGDSIMAMVVVIDVLLANIWMAVLLFFATHEKKMDASLGADRRRLEELRVRIEDFQNGVARTASLTDLMQIFCIAFGGTTLAFYAAPHLPELGGVLGEFAWKVIIATTIGVAMSFTRLRNLEGAGASKFGSLFLFLLVASIGAKAEFAKVLDAPQMLAVGAVWISIHAITLLCLRYFLKSPVFFMAVGSQANIGGAASAPIVAAAFHPALAPVGALMGIAGYVLGTYAGLVCAFLFQMVHKLW